ncbi:MAG: 4Fe-4S dicluster domain-containing protein [Candidatus Rokubacteria bacterium]|nr:4Fe-4S dicluster domain-containing protein [Candidatus Rokubacteria bacterium]
MARTLAMFTDTSLCIGCRACQVACKQWNELGAEMPEWTGSYQNHSHFTDKTYRLVRFMEDPKPSGDLAWLLMSDVCNGCRYCVSACPFGVVSFNHETGTVRKCTFCNDRIHNGLGPACAKACPTDSIQFGFREELVRKAANRVEALKAMGFKDAQLYGADSKGFLGGLNAFFLLLSKPATYHLPDSPQLPQRNVVVDSLLSIGSALVVGLGALMAFRDRGKGDADA